ncbi:MAG: amino acid adenylation domain-containing protein, partial [Bacteroidota bacterium]
AEQLPLPPKFYNRDNPDLVSGSERIKFTLTKEQSDQLRALTQETDLRSWTQDLSLFSIFASLLTAFVHRLTGQTEIAIGTPSHNRSSKAFKETPGLFIELFPLHTSVESSISFTELYQNVRAEALEFLRYAEAGASNPALHRGFNVVLNYINAAFPTFAEFPTDSEWIHASHADPGHHLRLQVYDFDADGSIVLGFDANLAIFTAEERRALPEQFSTLINAFITDRAQPIGRPVLGKRAASNQTENTELVHDDHVSVVDLVFDGMGEADKFIALQIKGQKISYPELTNHVNQLANYLRSNGLQPGDRVAVLLPRSAEFLISTLAIMRAGGIFVPIPTNYPSGRVLGIIEDAQPKFILSQAELAAGLPKTFGNLLPLDREATFIRQQSVEWKGSGPALAAPAYIMYTSGSTGRPKGVVISHRALSQYLRWAKSAYSPTEPVVAPLFTSVGFDLTITSLFLPLISGGTVVVYPEPTQGPDLAIFDVLQDDLVNFIKLTPSHLDLLVGKNYADSELRTMIVGGENFKVSSAEFVSQAFHPNLAIYNEYGPTEATVGCIVHQYDKTEDAHRTNVPIGQPMPHFTTYVFDEFGNPVPEGVAGELYLAGPGIAEGYWQQPDLTAEQFVQQKEHAGVKTYRTGDLVRWNVAEKHFEYLGRKDLQVKIRGRRVELAEIESALKNFPGITNGVVELRSRQRAIKVDDVHNCVSCGLPSNYPTADFAEGEPCHLCQAFTGYQQKVAKYFRTIPDLKAQLSSVPQEEKGEYDCLMLLSGGKDSTYALAQLKELGFNVLAFTLDNGYISEGAKENIRRVCAELGVDQYFGETEAMNAIFVDSLQRHCNVCDGCFKTIYTLSVQLALDKNIPFIVTGLSRGQFFETRLTEELFRQEEVDVDRIDEMILNARKAYHQVDDAVKELLDVSMFEDDSTFEKVRFVDFYRYTDVSLDEMYAYLNTRLPWVRPVDTGRSTNCLINQAGIYVHKKELGYSNYAFPYSWDVRIGHKTREASLDEINEVIDEQEVNRILEEIGYTAAIAAEAEREQLVAYYVSEDNIDEAALRSFLLTKVPDYMVPVQFIRLESLPLSINGKIDRDALPRPDTVRPVLAMEFVAPANEFEEIIQGVWSEVLQIDRIGVRDNFLQIGGDSLSGIRVISRLSEAFELDLPVNLIFQYPTITGLAEHIASTIADLLAEMENS